MVDNIAIDLWFYENSISMKDMRRKCNSMIDLSKFTSNKKIWSGVVVLIYNQVCCQNLIMLGLKKFRVISIFLKDKINHKFYI